MSLFRTEKQKMLAGELYRADDAELEVDRRAGGAWMVRYNAALGAQTRTGAFSCESYWRRSETAQKSDHHFIVTTATISGSD